MRTLLGLLVALAVSLPEAVVAQHTSRETAIQATISAQIEAFRRDDAGAAFAYASPMIQGLFGTPASFMDMVRIGYPQVYRPETVRFGALKEIEGGLYQHVVLKGTNGTVVTAVYEMVVVDGVWRINGCRLLRADNEA
jgi:hypothetical protein